LPKGSETLDVAARGTYKEFVRLSSIEEVEGCHSR